MIDMYFFLGRDLPSITVGWPQYRTVCRRGVIAGFLNGQKLRFGDLAKIDTKHVSYVSDHPFEF